MRGAEIESDHF